MTKMATFPPAATRKSPRRRNCSKFKITNNIQHQLLLGPTLARQAKKRKLREEEEAKRLQSLARLKRRTKNKKASKAAQEQEKVITATSPVRRKISPASRPVKQSKLSKFRAATEKSIQSTAAAAAVTTTATTTKSPTTNKACPQSPAPVTPDSLRSSDNSSPAKTREAKSALKFDRKKMNKDQNKDKNKEKGKDKKEGSSNNKNPKRKNKRTRDDSSTNSPSGSLAHRRSSATKKEVSTNTTQKKAPKTKNIKRGRNSSRNHTGSNDSAFAVVDLTGEEPVYPTMQSNNPPEQERNPSHNVPDSGSGDDADSSRRRRLLLASDDPQQLMMEVAVQRRMNVLRRKKLAVEALMTATDIPSIFSSLWAFRQLHDAVKTAPMALNLASDAQTTGNHMVAQWLTERFTSPRSFGGLAFSDMESQVLINRILDAFGASFGALDITAERLASAGIPASVAIDIHPHLACIVDEIRENIHWLFRRIMDATADALLPLCT